MLSYLPLGLEVLKSLAHICSVCNKFISAFFYASLHKYRTFHKYCACVMSNPCQQSICTDNGSFSHSSCVHTSILVSFANCRSYTPLFSQASISCFWLSLSFPYTLTSVFFMLSFLCHVFFSPPFMYCKCCSHFYLHRTNFAFWHGNSCLSCKVEFWFVSRGNICANYFFHHVGMFLTHFQIFMYYRTSIVVIISKSIFSSALVVSCRKGCRTKGSMCSYVLDDLCCVEKCLSVWSKSIYITFHIGFTDPTLSQILECSQQPSLMQPS